MKQEQLAQAWGMGAQSGTASNMFIENGIIYSYGYHFPIARWWKGHALLTNRGYSNVTAKQVAYVRQAIGTSSIIYMKQIPKDMGHLSYDHVENIQDYFASINGILPSLLSARNPQSYVDHILTIVDKMKAYINFFDLSKDFVSQFGIIPTAERLNQSIKEKQEIPQKSYKEILAEREKAETDKYPEHIANWKKGGSTRLFSDITRKLIAKDNVIHIRKRLGIVEVLGSGAEYDSSRIFPKYGNFYEAVMKNGGCEGDTGFRMFGITVTKITADKIYLGDKVLLASDIINKK